MASNYRINVKDWKNQNEWTFSVENLFIKIHNKMYSEKYFS